MNFTNCFANYHLTKTTNLVNNLLNCWLSWSNGSAPTSRTYRTKHCKCWL